MAYPTTSVLTDFNYTEDPLAHGFNTPLLLGDYQAAADGAAASNTHGGWASAYYTTVFDANCEVFAKIGSSGNGIRLFWRIANPNSSNLDGYTAEFNTSNTTNVYRIDNNTFTLLSSFSISSSDNNEQFGISHVGDTIRFFHDGVEVGTPITESTYSNSGYIGFRQFSAEKLDDFGGGSIIVAGSPRIDIMVGV